MQRSPLLWYKIGLAVVMLFGLGLAVSLAVQAGAVKRDSELNKTANDVATALESRISQQGAIPASLKSAYDKPVPKAITYKKLSDEKYRFCVKYETASSSLSTSLLPWWLGGYGDANIGTDSNDQAYLYISSDHKKGEDCQTITSPYTGSADLNQPGATTGTDGMNVDDGITFTSDARTQAQSSGSQTSVCGQGSAYDVHFAAQVTEVRTEDGKPVVPTTGQTILITVKREDTGSSQTLRLPPNSYNVFDANCTAQTYGRVQKGDYVSVFQDSSGSYGINAMVDFSMSR